jgi:hypothetical protein
MRICRLIAVVCLAGAPATADTVDVRFTSVSSARIVSVSGTYYNGSLYAGALNHQFANGTGAAAVLSGIRATFCTELTQLVNSSYHSFSFVTPANAPNPGSGMGTVKERALQEIYYRASTTWSDQQFSNPDLAAGFQALIWKIVYDYNPLDKVNSLSFSTGDVRVTGLNAAALSFANDLITSGIDSGNRELRLRAVINSTYQDQLILVPIPPAAFLAASAAPLFILAFRRRGR